MASKPPSDWCRLDLQRCPPIIPSTLLKLLSLRQACIFDVVGGEAGSALWPHPLPAAALCMLEALEAELLKCEQDHFRYVTRCACICLHHVTSHHSLISILQFALSYMSAVVVLCVHLLAFCSRSLPVYKRTGAL